MNFKKLVFLSVINFSLLTSVAQADIFLLSGEEDICSHVTGNWMGTGSVSASIGFITLRCQYNGNARVTSVSDPHQLVMDVHLTKTSGVFCPNEEAFQMPATCNSDGSIVISNVLSNLHGFIQENNGNYTVDLSGAVTMPINGMPVTANVDNMHLQKQS